jgi:hypothetical protein
MDSGETRISDSLGGWILIAETSGAAEYQSTWEIYMRLWNSPRTIL